MDRSEGATIVGLPKKQLRPTTVFNHCKMLSYLLDVWSCCVTNALCACLKKQTSCLLLFLGPLFLCDKIENNWKRVRHVPQSAGIWHPANDNLM